jgi:hypothetical protein
MGGLISAAKALGPYAAVWIVLFLGGWIWLDDPADPLSPAAVGLWLLVCLLIALALRVVVGLIAGRRGEGDGDEKSDGRSG